MKEIKGNFIVSRQRCEAQQKEGNQTQSGYVDSCQGDEKQRQFPKAVYIPLADGARDEASSSSVFKKTISKENRRLLNHSCTNFNK